jgi:acetoin utilization deacetylase AcuC-like enzyme
MTTILYSHPSCEGHDPGHMHPESPARLKAVLAALEAPDFAALDRREPPRAEVEQIARVHDRGYVEQTLAAVPDSGHRALDPDTVVSPGSGEAALRAAGAPCAAVDAIMAGEAKNALARAAVVDFDVHHGNGTQAMFWDQADLFFASTHQMPLYPGTGSTGETGATGNILNLPLAPLAGTIEFRRAMSESVLPAVRAFKPEFLFVSAGFDAHADDPLANLRFQDEDYAWATRELAQLAAECCEGRLVTTLEGGYDLHALARSVALHVRALMDA